MAERNKPTTTRKSDSTSKGSTTKKAATRSRPTAKPNEAETREDPLKAQGLGEEDFSSRDYTIPGVDAEDPDPYKWHTGAKRDHGGVDAIEIIDLVKQFGRTRILNGCNRSPGQHDLDGAGAVGHRQVGADQAHRRTALSRLG